MKITESRLKQIIKEEMEALKLHEAQENEQEATDKLQNFLKTRYPETELMSHLDPDYYDEFGDGGSYIIVNNNKKVTGVGGNERADTIARDINKNFGSSILAHMQDPKFSGGDGPYGTTIHLEFIKDTLAEREALAIASQAPQMEAAAPDMFGEPDEEGGMARGELYKIAKYGQETREMLKDDDQLPAWVQSKITKCAAMMGDVKHFLEGQMADQSDDMKPVQDETQEDDFQESYLSEMIAQELSNVMEKKKVNPWAVCTTSVGREDKDKFESCVMDVKKKQGMK